jgi:glycosyltransferase involved in cell wall biosynthesis
MSSEAVTKATIADDAVRTLRDRLHKAGGRPWWQRTLSSMMCYAIVASALALGSLRSVFRWSATIKKKSRPARIVLTGGFVSDGWVAAHVAPLASSTFCQHVWIVTDRPFKNIAKVTYCCPSPWSTRVLGKTGARLFCFLWVSITRRADIVGGFHLLCNGLAALAISGIVRARCVYFSVGGWAEILGGGSFSGTPLFGATGVNDRRLEGMLLNAISRFDLTITMGTKAKRFFQESGVERIQVVPGGIDAATFSRGESAPDIDIILVARFDPIKRIDVFLQAMQLIVRAYPQLNAVVVGDGPLRPQLEALRKSLDIERQVQFAGFHHDVSRWLRRARIFALTSDSEGLPLAAMEATLIGLPVVASNVGDMSDLVIDGKNGYLVAPRDAATFAARILDLLREPTKLKSCSQAAARVGRNFRLEAARTSWDTAIAHLGFAKSP